MHETHPPKYYFIGDDSADLHFDVAALPEGWEKAVRWAHFGCISLARQPLADRLVATAEDDNARADLLAFAAEVPAEAWQELALASGETVAGRLRFAPAAPVRLALWRKPLET